MRAKYWRHGVLIGVLIVATFWLTTLIWNLAAKVRVALYRVGEVKTELAALEARKEVLEANVAMLETERGRDSAIRTAFGVARPGEEVIVVVPPTPASTTPEVLWWQKILNWF